MAVPKKITNFLEKGNIKYETIEHKTVYTAYDKAATLKVHPKEIAKTLVVKLDRNVAFVVIPGNKNLDKMKIKKEVNKQRKKEGLKAVKKISFATERWMKNNLKGVKIGSTPIFGNIWKMPTYIDRGLMKNKKIIVPSGDYKVSFKISPTKIKKAISDLVITSLSKPKKK